LKGQNKTTENIVIVNIAVYLLCFVGFVKIRGLYVVF